MSAEFIVEQLKSTVEFLEHKVKTTKSLEERTKLEKELAEAKDQLGRLQNLNS